MENAPRELSAYTREYQVPTGDRVQADKALAVIILRAILLQTAAIVANDSGYSRISSGLLTKLS